MSDKGSQPQAASAAREEERRLARDVLVWLNHWPRRPEDVPLVDFQSLPPDAPGMALFPVQGGPRLVERYILGGYRAEYPFRVLYRTKPGSPDERLRADELLDQLGAWAAGHRPRLDGLHVLRVETAAPGALLERHPNGDEDHDILMKLTYEVI